MQSKLAELFTISISSYKYVSPLIYEGHSRSSTSPYQLILIVAERYSLPWATKCMHMCY